VASRVFGKVEALDRAAAEISHEVEYYLRHGGPAVARAFLEEFVLIAKRIAEDPRSFPPWPHQPGVRRAKLNRFPFFVGFVVGPKSNEDLPLVVVVAHGRRRPGYWLGRVKTRAKRKRL
jgi:toxin ParE1/3/4